MTLHEAIVEVLKENPLGLTRSEIAEIINQKKLYERGDREPVPSNQIGVRVKKYPHLFTKDGSIIKLRSLESQTQKSKSVVNLHEKRMTLHNEIVAILEEDGEMMTTREIADKVNERKNYFKRDGSNVTPFQIHGRTKNYPHLFTRDGNKVGRVKLEEHAKDIGQKDIPIKLHEEIEKILEENGDPLSTKVLADTVNRRENYINKDRSKVTPGQIFIKAKEYSKIFNIEGNLIGLLKWDNPDIEELMVNYNMYFQDEQKIKLEDTHEKKENLIRSYGISNFKPYSDLQKLKLKPITLLFGPNSSGKSSLIHSLLYFSNALMKNELSPSYMKISGDSVDLGGFKQLIYKRDFQRTLTFNIVLDVKELKKKSLEIFSEVKEIAINIEIKQPLEQRTRRKVTRVEDETSFYDEVPTDEFYPSNKPPQVVKYEIITDDIPLLAIGYKQDLLFRVDHLNTNNRIIRSLAESLISANTTSMEMSNKDWEIVQEALDELVVQLYSTSKDFLPRNLKLSEISKQLYNKDIVPRSKADKENDLKKSLTMFFPHTLNELLTAIYDELNSQFSNMEYLGPVRSYPPRHLLFNDDNNPNYISGGGRTWTRLRDEKDLRKKVNNWLSSDKLKTKYKLEVRNYIDIDSNEFDEQVNEAYDQFNYEIMELNIENNMSELIKKRMIDENSIDGIKDLVLVDKKSNTVVSHRDVGFGISQVIPVLVSAYGNKNKIVLIEQPEIHLHPALQAELGDVFVENAIGENNNTFIIETHSEHLLKKLQVLVAKNKLNKEDLVIYYIDKINDAAILKEIKFDEYGFFKDPWPNGFFDDSFELTKQLIRAKKN